MNSGQQRSPAFPRSSSGRYCASLLVFFLLAACGTTSQNRVRLTAPAQIGNVYSDVNLEMELATVDGVDVPCAGSQCEQDRAFEQQVRALGGRLAQAAFALHPGLHDRVGQFEFVVVEKEAPGVLSSANGRVLVLRGTQELRLDEMGLAFVIAREMGHVIARHHDENTGTRIAFSALAGIFFPAINLFGATSAAAQAGSAASTASTATTTVTTLSTAAASSATSWLGSRLMLKQVKPDQLAEADAIAVALLEATGWPSERIVTAFALEAAAEDDGEWMEDLRTSLTRLPAAPEPVIMADVAVPEAAQESDLPALWVAEAPDEGLPVPAEEEEAVVADAVADTIPEVAGLPEITAPVPVLPPPVHIAVSVSKKSPVATPSRVRGAASKAPRVRHASRAGRGKGRALKQASLRGHSVSRVKLRRTAALPAARSAPAKPGARAPLQPHGGGYAPEGVRLTVRHGEERKSALP